MDTEPKSTSTEALSTEDTLLSLKYLPPTPKEARLKSDGSNYLVWRNLLDAQLESVGYITEGTNAERPTRQDCRVAVHIISSCTLDIQSTHLIGRRSPLAMLTILAETFQPQGRKRGYLAWLRL